MGHVSEGTLRRLVDEPLAVPDAEARHARTCGRCRRHRERVAADAEMARALLSRPQPAPDVDSGWRRLQAAGAGAEQANPPAAHVTVHRRRYLVPTRRPSRATLVAAAVFVAGVALSSTLTAVLSPAKPAPAASSTAGFQELADVVGFGRNGGVLGGFDRRSGTISLPFGTLSWSSSGAAHRVASLAEARRQTGLALAVPSQLPSGVGAPTTIVVQPAVTATISFGSGTGKALQGTTLTVRAGPAAVAEYGSATGGLGIPTLGIFWMAKPSASTGSSSSQTSTAAQLEAYVLSRPGLPDGLVQEIRLLSNISSILPAAVPGGASISQVDIAGSPGILVTDGSDGAAGVIWVNRSGVHAVLGLLDQQDVLHVADQLG